MSVTPSGIKSEFELVVGLEVHVQLSTKSKIFSADAASFGGQPNDHISAISLGLPGTLPRLNRKVVEYAIKMGLATNCRINSENHFDRKNYFYADLPKGFQTTQDSSPICVDGYIEVAGTNDTVRKIRINRIHMEDDAGKSMHDQHPEYSLIDLNRAGVPLIEIVSEPDIRSAAEAASYLQEIQKLVRYLGISDGNMEEGSIRCDANISVRPWGSAKFGNRCEVKNLNSVRNLQKAIDFEFERQCALVEAGVYIEQNTLNFDANTGETSPLRSKEMANDYRYFPEPDLPPLILAEEFIDELKSSLPELPAMKRERLMSSLGLSHYDAGLISVDRAISDYFEQICSHTGNSKSAANWLNGPIRSWINDAGKDISSFPIKADGIARIIELIDLGKISYTAAVQKLFPALLNQPSKDPRDLAVELNILIDSDSNTLDVVITEVLDAFPVKVNEFLGGKKGLTGFFMGEVMKRTGGTIDPREANKLLVQILNSKK